MNLQNLRLIGDLITATAYLLGPLLIWWGARYATKIPGWGKLSLLLSMAGVGHLVNIVSYYKPMPVVVACWATITGGIGLLVTWKLWAVIGQVSPRFLDLPREEAADYIDKIPFPACIVDDDGFALAINHLYTELMGVRIEDIRGHAWIGHIKSEDRERVSKAWKDFFEKRSASFQEDFRWKHPTRGIILVQGQGYVNGKCTVCGIQDITGNALIEEIQKTVQASCQTLQSVTSARG